MASVDPAAEFQKVKEMEERLLKEEERLLKEKDCLLKELKGKGISEKERLAIRGQLVALEGSLKANQDAQVKYTEMIFSTMRIVAQQGETMVPTEQVKKPDYWGRAIVMCAKLSTDTASIALKKDVCERGQCCVCGKAPQRHRRRGQKKPGSGLHVAHIIKNHNLVDFIGTSIPGIDSPRNYLYLCGTHATGKTYADNPCCHQAFDEFLMTFVPIIDPDDECDSADRMRWLVVSSVPALNGKVLSLSPPPSRRAMLFRTEAMQRLLTLERYKEVFNAAVEKLREVDTGRVRDWLDSLVTPETSPETTVEKSQPMAAAAVNAPQPANWLGARGKAEALIEGEGTPSEDQASLSEAKHSVCAARATKAIAKGEFLATAKGEKAERSAPEPNKTKAGSKPHCSRVPRCCTNEGCKNSLTRSYYQLCSDCWANRSRPRPVDKK
jgi:hypothetical protein